MMKTFEATEHSEQLVPERKILRGLSDWKRVVEAAGQYSLADFLETMDPGNPFKTVNAHRVIAERVQALGMPAQPYITAPVEEFVARPDQYLTQLRGGDYFFASIRPGTHLAHAACSSEVISFVQEFVARSSDAEDQQQELYLSRNGEPVLSGHIIVRGDGTPNTIAAEFTHWNFNDFHRGLSTPEISVQRPKGRFVWDFSGSLQPTGDWRTNEKFMCNGGVELTRLEMARKIFSAIQHIPHDNGLYLSGYYEVLLERTDTTHTRTTFIEAITDKKVSAYL